MKIIATTGRDSYLLSADAREIGRIMGEDFANNRSVGTEIPISDMYIATREIVAGAKELTDQSEKVLKLMNALKKFGATIGPIAAKISEKELKS